MRIPVSRVSADSTIIGSVTGTLLVGCGAAAEAYARVE